MSEEWTPRMFPPPTAAQADNALRFESDPKAREAFTADEQAQIFQGIHLWRKQGLLSAPTAAAEGVDTVEAALIHAGSQFAKQGIGIGEAARRASHALLLSQGAQYPGGVPPEMMAEAQAQVQMPLLPENEREIVDINRQLEPVLKAHPVASVAGEVAPYIPGLGVGAGIRAGAVEGAAQALFNPEASVGVGAIAGAAGGAIGRVLKGSPKSSDLLMDKAGYRMRPSDRFELRQEAGEKLGVVDVFKHKLTRMLEAPGGAINPLEAGALRNMGVVNQRMFNERAVTWVGKKIGLDLGAFRRGSGQLREAISAKVESEWASLRRKTTTIRTDGELAEELKAWRTTNSRKFTHPTTATNDVFEQLAGWIEGAGGRELTTNDVIDYGTMLSHQAWTTSGPTKQAIYALRDVMDNWAVRRVRSLSHDDLTRARHTHHLAQLLNEVTTDAGQISGSKLASRMEELGYKPSKEPLAAEASFVATTNERLNRSGHSADSLLPTAVLLGAGTAAGLSMNDDKDSQSSAFTPAMLGLGLAAALSPRLVRAGAKPKSTAAIGRLYGQGVIDPVMRAARAASADDRLRATHLGDTDGG